MIQPASACSPWIVGYMERGAAIFEFVLEFRTKFGPQYREPLNDSLVAQCFGLRKRTSLRASGSVCYVSGKVAWRGSSTHLIAPSLIFIVIDDGKPPKPWPGTQYLQNMNHL